MKFDPNGPAIVELAKIVAVYPEAYSCEVVTVSGNKPIGNVKMMSPMLHDLRGAGVNMMPIVDSLCYILIPADGSGAFVLGYTFVEDPSSPTSNVSSYDGPDFSGERPKLEPGDIYLSTPDENFVILRRGGVVQIGATSLAQTVYIPMGNLVRDYFVRYHGFSPIGEIIWDHAQVDLASLAKGDTPAIVKFSCKEKLQDARATVELRLGRLDTNMLDGALDSNLLQEGITGVIDKLPYTGAGDKEHLAGSAKAKVGNGYTPSVTDPGKVGILSFTINPQGEAVKYIFQIDKEGSNFIRSEAFIHVECAKKAYFHAVEQIDIEQGDNVKVRMNEAFRAMVKSAVLEILANEDVLIKGNNIKIEASGNVDIKCNKLKIASSATTIEADMIKLGGEGATMDIACDSAANWSTFLQSHTHAAPGGATGSPLPPPTGRVASKVKVQ